MLPDARTHQASRRSQGLWPVIFVANFTIFALVVLGGFIYSGQVYALDAEGVIRFSCVILLGVYVWTVWSWKTLTGSIFNPYILFLTAAYLFNGGQTLLQIFGLNKLGMLEGQFSDETVLKTIFLITIGFLALHAGGLLSHLFFKESREERPGGTGARWKDLKDEQFTRLVGWGLLFVAIVPAALSVRENLTLSLSVGYMAIFTQEISRGYGATSSILANLIIPAVIFLVAGSRGLRLNVILATVVVVVYCAALFLAGQRGTATMLLVAYAWVYHGCIKPISKWSLMFGGAFLLFVVFPVVSIVRGSSTGDTRLSPGNFLDTFASIDNPFVASISEMGFSMTTVAYTVDLIPGARDFDWGVGYLYGLLGAFPNLFWEAHPSFVHGTPSLWLVETVAPSAAIQGQWGLGYSFIAEAYYSFGWLGAPVALTVIGLFIGGFFLWAERSGNTARIAAVGAFTAFVLIFARGEFLTSFGRPLLWYALIPYWAILFLQAFSFHNSRKFIPRMQENKKRETDSAAEGNSGDKPVRERTP